MTCKPIRFGYANTAQNAALTVSPAATTTAENIKTTWRGRQAVWGDLSASTVVILGVYPSDVTADFISIAGSNISDDATVLFELFDGVGIFGTELLSASAVSMPVGVVPFDPLTGASMDRILTNWFSASITFRTYRITITHAYDAQVTIDAGTASQDAISGHLIMDSSDGVASDTDGANLWESTADADATEDTYMKKVGASTYTASAGAPKLTFTMYATHDGQHDLYVRTKQDASNKNVIINFDGEGDVARIFPASTEWNWHMPYSASFSIDKIVVQPRGESAPTGEGPARSRFGVVSTTDNVAIRMVYIGTKLEMSESFMFGSEAQLVTSPDMGTSYGGYGIISRAQNTARRMSITLPRMSEADKIGLATLESTQLGAPFIVSAYPEDTAFREHTHTMLANFVNAMSYRHRSEAIHRVQLDMIEV